MKIKLGVFFGGKSVEHEVSIITALQAIENIDSEKYEVIPIYISKDNKMYCGHLIGKIEEYKDIDNIIKNSTQVTLAKIKNSTVLLRCERKFLASEIYDNIDIAFPIVHGTNVEDGTLQGYLKMFDIPYIGSDIISSSIGMDKYVCKCLLKENNIPVLDCKHFNSKEYSDNKNKIIKDIETTFGYPVIVKPVNLGSSVGIEVAKTKRELEESILDAFTYSNKILIEKDIQNLREINCSVLGDFEECETSECEEPIKTDEILSFNDKYISGGKKLGIKFGNDKSMNQGCLKLPADITKEQKEFIQDISKKTFKALGCNGVIRIDFLIDVDTSKIYVNEVNTIPGSLSFHLWKATNLNYTKLIDRLIELSLKRYRNEKNLTFSFDSNILAGYSNGIKGIKNLK